VWWIVTTLVIQPAFGRLGNNVFEMAAIGGGRGAGGIYQTLWADLSGVLAQLREGGLYYLYQLLRSVGFVGLLGWEGLLALPATLVNLIVPRVFHSSVDPLAPSSPRGEPLRHPWLLHSFRRRRTSSREDAVMPTRTLHARTPIALLMPSRRDATPPANRCQR